MKKLACFLLCLAVLAACGSKGKELVSVNGKVISEGDLDFLATMNPRLKAQISTPFGKKQILDNLVEQELLYQAALKKGLQRDSAVKAKFDLYKKVLIAQALIENEITNAAKEYYKTNKPEFEKLQISDILVKFASNSKEEPKDKKAPAAPKPAGDKVTRTKDAALKLANEIKAKLDKGEAFAELAKEYSEDPISKNMGGDLGKVSKNDPRLDRRGMGPVIEKAMTMQVGQTAGPIETQEGYHIITVTKGLELQPYEEVEQGILFKIQGDERNKLMTELKKNAKVVYAGEEGKKEEAASATGTPPAPTASDAKSTPTMKPAAPATPITVKPAPAPAKPEPAKKK